MHSASSPGQRRLAGAAILIALNLRPFLTAIGPWPSHRREAGPRGGYPGLGHPAALWLIGVGVLLTPALLGRTGPRPLLGTALLLLALGSALRLDLASGALLIASAALCGLGSALVQGCCPASSRRGSPKGAPGDGIFSACMMGAGARGRAPAPCRVSGLVSGAGALGPAGAVALGWLAWRVPLPARPARPSPPGSSGCPCPAPGCSSPVLASSTAATASSWPLAGLHGGGLERLGGELVAWSPWPRPRAALACLCWQPVGWTAAPGWRWPSPCSWRALAASGSLPDRPLLWCLLCGAGLGGASPHHGDCAGSPARPTPGGRPAP
jgi:CP family cyanate transporter-like MFS transporter